MGMKCVIICSLWNHDFQKFENFETLKIVSSDSIHSSEDDTYILLIKRIHVWLMKSMSIKVNVIAFIIYIYISANILCWYKFIFQEVILFSLYCYFVQILKNSKRIALTKFYLKETLKVNLTHSHTFIFQYSYFLWHITTCAYALLLSIYE